MARTKVLTDEQRAAQKAKWNAARDARRRIRYHGDDEYQAKQQALSRDYFRQRHGMDSAAFTDCRRNYDQLHTIGKVREARFEDEHEPYLTFTVPEAAKAFGDYNPRIMHRWIAKGMLPAPLLEVSEVTGSFGRADGTSILKVYTEEEIKAVIEVLGAHQSAMRYYRASHTNTVQEINDAVAKVRKELNIGTE